MNSSVSIEKFKQTINEFDVTYGKFDKNERPSYKELYVESSDDAQFYGHYLADIYFLQEFTKCYGCNGRDEVLKHYIKYTGKKAGFIIDHDYKFLDKKYSGVVVTTGYSMENFFFYKNNDVYNFEKIFETIYKNNDVCKKKLEEYKKLLKTYLENSIDYYAFFKTCMEVSNHSYYNQHKNIKELLGSKCYLKEEIDKEINELNPSIQKNFRDKYEANKKIIMDEEYMMLRGHDIFDHLYDFLKVDKAFLKKSDIIKLSKGMTIPQKFKDKFFNI